MRNFIPFLSKIEFWGNKNAQLNFSFYTLQISRTLLATATLATLISSPTNAIFTEAFFERLEVKNTILSNYNLFILIGFKKLIIAKIICIVVLIGVISGYLKKIISVLHWYVAFSFFSVSTIIDGGDQIASILTLLIIPISMCDQRKNTWNLTGRSSDSNNYYFTFFSNVILFIIQVQVAIIYLNSGVAKISVPDWNNGSAYYYWFSHNSFGAPDYLRYLFGHFFSNPFLVALVSWGTIIFEIALFGCIFSRSRKLKVWMFLMGLIFHLMIFLVHGLFSFFLVMSSCLFLYLLSDGTPLNLKKKL